MARTPDRSTASLIALAISLVACGPCVSPRMAPGPPVDETRPVATHDPAADDHQAPQRADAAARRTFWAPLDRLVERVR